MEEKVLESPGIVLKIWGLRKKELLSTNSVIEWLSMRKQVLRGLLTYVRLFDVVE